MNKYLQSIKEFQNNNKAGIYFVKNQLAKHLEKHEENQTEIEHILDYLYSTGKTFKVGYITIKEKADKWSKKLQQVVVKDIEKEGVDYKVLKKWKNGFKVVKLISKESYQREGKLMSHCVADYYGKDDEIYSLRDEKNLPHCTMSKSSEQIKGKGNNGIIPKYIKYVVEFLEKVGMEVRGSEMKNLGYVNIEDIEDKNAVFKPLFRKKYFYKENEIVDKKGNKYENITLWNAFGLANVSSRFKVSFNFDISLSIRTFLSKINKATAVANESYSTAVANEGSVAILNNSNNSKVKAKIGGAIVIVERDDNNIKHIFSAIVDGKKIKEDTWYTLKNGKIIKV